MSKVIDFVNEAVVRMAAQEEGQGMVEYGLILVLVALVVITAVTLLGTNVSTVFNNAANGLNP